MTATTARRSMSRISRNAATIRHDNSVALFTSHVTTSWPTTCVVDRAWIGIAWILQSEGFFIFVAFDYRDHRDCTIRELGRHPAGTQREKQKVLPTRSSIVANGSKLVAAFAICAATSITPAFAAVNAYL